MRITFFVFCLLNCFSLYGGKQEDLASVERVFLTKEAMESHPEAAIRALSTFDKGRPRYLLFLKNFPVNKKMKYSVRRLCQEDRSYQYKGDIIVDEQGTIICGEISTSCLSLPSLGFLLGEKISCRFMTEEGDFNKIISFIPNPLISKNASGTVSVEAELSIIQPVCFYKIHFRGFTEKESLRFVSRSGNEKCDLTFQTPEAPGWILFSPDVEGLNGGIAELVFIRENKEKIQMDIPWGEELLNEMENCGK